MFLLKFSLILTVFLALGSSIWWTIFISTSSRSLVAHDDRRLREELVSDLWDIEKLSTVSLRLKVLEFCSQRSENYVPCFNVSKNLGHYDRNCAKERRENCLVYPPAGYKIPLRWPTGRDAIWGVNVKITAQEVLSSGSLTKRMMMLEEEQISFHSASIMFDCVENYTHQIAEMIGLRNQSNLVDDGVRTVLDIGCGYGSFGAHIFSKQVLTMCIANYEATGSQVQVTLERGLPAMIGSLTSKQLPYPSLSFDMLHCAQCGIRWDKKDGLLLIEVDRILKPGGYFIWTSPATNIQKFLHDKEKQKRWIFVRDFAECLCWKMLSHQDDTVIWKKATKRKCYSLRKPRLCPPICRKGLDIESPYYRSLQACIGGANSRRWIPIEERTKWPSRAKLNSTELEVYGLHPEEFNRDTENWRAAVQDYWSLPSPSIFSDHPKRPGDEDPSRPYNMLRNVLDMNADFGGLNSALLEAGKSVWVMNIVPTSALNYLPLILTGGLSVYCMIGVIHFQHTQELMIRCTQQDFYLLNFICSAGAPPCSIYSLRLTGFFAQRVG